MKAIRVAQFGGPEVLQIQDVPLPSPADDQLLIRIHAIGVNPVETYIRAGTYAVRPELPYTPGGDAAGIVEAVGSAITLFQPGDRVYTAGTFSGSYAEYALCTAAQVHPLPDKVSFSQGAAVGIPYATAHRALFQRGAVQPGETVLVHGASGGVGLAAIQLAAAQGLTVWGTAGSAAGLQLILKNGAALAFDHSTPDYLNAIREAHGGRGIDLILEMLANRNLAHDLTLLAPSGRVVIIGSRGPVEINPRDAMSRDADIRGMVLFNTPPEELAAIHRELVSGLQNGELSPVIGQEFPLTDAAKAHERVMQNGAMGKIILTI